VSSINDCIANEDKVENAGADLNRDEQDKGILDLRLKKDSTSIVFQPKSKIGLSQI
jgi:hypothetical protein